MPSEAKLIRVIRVIRVKKIRAIRVIRGKKIIRNLPAKRSSIAYNPWQKKKHFTSLNFLFRFSIDFLTQTKKGKIYFALPDF